MAVMDVGTRSAVSNLLQTQRSGFDRVVDKQGQLVEGKAVGGNRVQRFLVGLV